MDSKHIFYDPNSTRAKWGKRIIAGSSIIIATILTVFIFSIVGVSIFPTVTGHKHSSQIKFPKLPERKDKKIQFVYKAAKNKLWNNIDSSKNKIAGAQKNGDKIVAGFYATWQETGLHSLRANASKMTHVFPAWLSLNPDGISINYSEWNPDITPHNLDVVSIARSNQLRIIPILSNAKGDGFDPGRVHKLLGSKSMQTHLTDSITNWLVANNFDGINIDFENLKNEDYPKLIPFLKMVNASFHKHNLQLSIDIEAGKEIIPVKQIADICDYIILMVYDEHDASNDAGPIASAGWFQRVVDKFTKIVPENKLVVGLGNYSTDWNPAKKTAESITYQMAILAAYDNNPEDKPADIIKYNTQALNNYFYYYDDAGDEHEVWMLDAVSMYNHLKILQDYNNKGIAVWALGFEDPSMWKLINRNNLYQNLNTEILSTLDFPFEIDFEGEGEVLKVVSYPEKGSRYISVDEGTGLIDESYYNKFPSTYVIQRAGYKEKTLALTFDDGPSDEYSIPILDVLKKYNVKATFFVIGENAESYPSIIRRMWNEGHEIGSHTFTHPNLGNVSKQRTILELNATERALQGILKRSTTLFRPPYNADAEPVSAEEIQPIITATQLGYLTIGELIDPQDWQLYKTDSEGNKSMRTVEDLADSIYDQIKQVKGNSILLHDGGGNRAKTIQVLDIIIPRLLEQGYKFETISELIGKKRADVMPPYSGNDIFLVGVDSFLFETIFSIDTFLSLAFIIAIILGISRVIFILLLIFFSRLKKEKTPFDSEYRPFVSVIIAAFNEETVIEKTINSIRESDYNNYEIIVVDDGSTDGTYEVLKTNYKENKSITILTQPNSGKAIALNNAIKYAKGEILVSFDADTQVLPNTISMLIRNFNNPDVGAVAGNIKAGNRHNIISRWQSIEYITSQNLDRKAYSLLNSITVVPGAIGAWRTKAVKDAGGYIPDTLAEDMDLTWRLRENNWIIKTENEAIAYTEVPDTFRNFFKQRFRWSFGTLQCLWKHKKSLFRYEWFGWLALPSLWLFQIAFQVIAPLVDVQIFFTIFSYCKDYFAQGMATGNWTPITQGLDSIRQLGFFYLLFFTLELFSSLIAFTMEKEKYSDLWLLFWQRFVYRQLMYLVIWKALLTAFRGKQQGWGKLLRKGNVSITH
ncbi:MAG: glycosyltransferase [Bacteroidota bacterium]|nr:glycosyltransferase [Bacteroidota bacterium]